MTTESHDVALDAAPKKEAAQRDAASGLSFEGLTWGSALVGVAIAVTELALAIALAAILFAGPLESGLSRAGPAFILGGGIVSIVVAWRSRMDGTIAGTQDLAAIVLLTGASATAAQGDGDPAMTMIAILATTALVYAAALWAIDHFGLVEVVRFLPSTVVIGFVAGTGWLLGGGGLQVATASSDTISNLFGVGSASPSFWLPCLALAAVIATATLVERVPTVLIGLSVIGAVGLFYLVVAAVSSVDAVAADNLLIGPFDDIDRWRPITPGDLRSADLGAVVASWPAIAAAVFVSIIGVLLNLKGLEDSQEGSFDFGTELRSVSGSNVLVGLAGGLIGFHSLGNSTMATKNGVRGSLIPFAVGVVGIAAAVLGGGAFGYLPRFVAGGVLLGTGTVLLIEAGRSLWAMRSIEALIGLAILAVVIRWGMLEGVAAGLAGAVMIFLVRYSRIEPVRSEGNVTDHSSRVDRPDAERQALLADPDQIRVLRLQGYLFFGSVDRFRARVMTLLDDFSPACVVVDFRHVTGVDASAITSFRRVRGAAQQRGTKLLFANADHVFVGESEPGEVFSDLDHALQHAEQLMIERADLSAEIADLGISKRLQEQFVSLTFADGDEVVTIGDDGDSIFIIAEGWCVASLPTPSGSLRRLREFGVGSMVGEIGFMAGTARTANIHAKGHLRLLAMDRDRYDRVAESDPELIIELGQRMLAISSGRVQDLSRRLNQELS